MGKKVAQKSVKDVEQPQESIQHIEQPKKEISKSEIVKTIRKEKKFLKDKYNVNEIGLFGSFSRSAQNKRSDIDILIDFSVIPDLFTYVEIMLYLKEKLGRKVDLVMQSALRPEIKDYVMKEVIFL